MNILSSAIGVLLYLSLLELNQCIDMPIYIGQYGDVANIFIVLAKFCQKISEICAYESCYAIVLHRVFGNPSYYCVSD